MLNMNAPSRNSRLSSRTTLRKPSGMDCARAEPKRERSVLICWRRPMQRSSESVAELAAALAKAQTELVNPEKSLTATIFGEGRGEARSFRYAPLSGGLD